jgi:hypothetical protein
MSSPEDWERARIVDDDLRYLIDEWVPRLDEASLRRDSPLLRRLLVEDQWGQAWRSLGLPREPYVSASSLDRSLHETTRGFIQFACAPPATAIAARVAAESGDVKVEVKVLEDIPPGSVIAVAPGYPQHLGVILLAIPPDALAREASQEDALKRYLRPGGRHIRALPVSGFLASPFALITGVEVSRRDVIAFVANKLGGVHFDPRRGPEEERLALLDRDLPSIFAAGIEPTSAVYIELLSIAQFVAESSDAARYRDEFRRQALQRGDS